MTRRGSLAYYLAAWVCGGLFFAATSFITAPRNSVYGLTPDTRGFLVASFFVLAYGWVFTLAFAFILRRLASVLRWHRPWPWTIFGGALALAFALACSALPVAWLLRSSWLRSLAGLFELNASSGASLSSRSALAGLATILAGMLTAFLLFRVDRAFSPREDVSK
ncbi:MAG TPA: hypothetical protein VOA41_01655 [Candidatus Dormibacteraeota bacterium]|nr:hypothetical protein [Candidatus Dormibacteraeota bacterium]